MLHRFASAFLLLSASAVLADPLPTSLIPEDTRWIIHGNVDAARNSPLWKIVAERFVKPRHDQIAPKVQMIESLTGLSIPDGLHDVTLFGTSFDESSVCMLFHANVDQNRIIGFLKLDPEFTSTDHNGHAIVSWRDKERDRLMYATFAPNDMVILAPTPKTIYLTLDTLDHKSPAIKVNSPLAPAMTGAPQNVATAGPALWIAGTSISELPRAQNASPILAQLDTASIAIASADDKVTARVTIVARNDKVAQQLAAVAEGLKAFVMLQTADEHAGPAVKTAASLLQNLAIVSDGKNISADWTVSAFQLDLLVQTGLPGEGMAGNGPMNLGPTTPASVDKKP